MHKLGKLMIPDLTRQQDLTVFCPLCSLLRTGCAQCCLHPTGNSSSCSSTPPEAPSAPKWFGPCHWPCRAHGSLLQTHCPSCNACGWLVTQHSSAGPKCCQVPVRPAAMATSDGSLWASVHTPSGHPCKNTQIIAGHFCCYGKSYVSISITNPYLEEFSNVTIKLCSEP